MLFAFNSINAQLNITSLDGPLFPNSPVNYRVSESTFAPNLIYVWTIITAHPTANAGLFNNNTNRVVTSFPGVQTINWGNNCDLLKSVQIQVLAYIPSALSTGFPTDSIRSSGDLFPGRGLNSNCTANSGSENTSGGNTGGGNPGGGNTSQQMVLTGATPILGSQQTYTVTASDFSPNLLYYWTIITPHPTINVGSFSNGGTHILANGPGSQTITWDSDNCGLFNGLEIQVFAVLPNSSTTLNRLETSDIRDSANLNFVSPIDCCAIATNKLNSIIDNNVQFALLASIPIDSEFTQSDSDAIEVQIIEPAKEIIQSENNGLEACESDLIDTYNAAIFTPLLNAALARFSFSFSNPNPNPGEPMILSNFIGKLALE